MTRLWINNDFDFGFKNVFAWVIEKMKENLLLHFWHPKTVMFSLWISAVCRRVVTYYCIICFSICENPCSWRRCRLITLAWFRIRQNTRNRCIIISRLCIALCTLRIIACLKSDFFSVFFFGFRDIAYFVVCITWRVNAIPNTVNCYLNWNTREKNK